MTKTAPRTLATLGIAAATLALALCGVGCESRNNGILADENTAMPADITRDTEIPMFMMGEYVLKAGMTAPDFTVQLVDENGFTGETLTLSDLRGTPVVVDFWSTWCPFCVDDHPRFQEAIDEYGDRVVFIAVDAGGDTFGELCDYIRDNDYGFTYAITNEAMAKAYPCPGVPYTIMIDQEGTIAYLIQGSYRGKTLMAIEQTMDALLD